MKARQLPFHFLILLLAQPKALTSFSVNQSTGSHFHCRALCQRTDTVKPQGGVLGTEVADLSAKVGEILKRKGNSWARVADVYTAHSF